MYKVYSIVLFTLMVGLSSGFCLAAEHQKDSDEMRQHGAHEHGVAQLNVALDGNELAMELISPAANIVGFEHEPGNDEQQKAVDDAIATLQDGSKIFAFPDGAGCQLLANAEVETMMLDDEHHDEHHDDEHDDHDHAKKDDHDDHDDHAKKDDHDEHDDHAKEDDHDDHEEETHSEFHVVYQFNCADPGQLSHIDVVLFTTFPATEELDAQVIGPNGQTAVELTADSARLSF